MDDLLRKITHWLLPGWRRSPCKKSNNHVCISNTFWWWEKGSWNLLQVWTQYFIGRKWVIYQFIKWDTLKLLYSISFGTSLVVWWLRLWTSIAGGVGSPPGWGTKIPQFSQKKKKKNLFLNIISGKSYSFYFLLLSRIKDFCLAQFKGFFLPCELKPNPWPRNLQYVGQSGWPELPLSHMFSPSPSAIVLLLSIFSSSVCWDPSRWIGLMLL